MFAIAEKTLGDASRWEEIHALNPQITNPDLIFPGQEIKIMGTLPAPQAAMFEQTPTVVPPRPKSPELDDRECLGTWQCAPQADNLSGQSDAPDPKEVARAGERLEYQRGTTILKESFPTNYQATISTLIQCRLKGSPSYDVCLSALDAANQYHGQNLPAADVLFPMYREGERGEWARYVHSVAAVDESSTRFVTDGLLLAGALQIPTPKPPTQQATQPAQQTTQPTRTLYSVDPKMMAADEAAGVLKDGRYITNPSTQNLKELLTETGKIGGKQKSGQFMYVVDAEGNILIGTRAGQRMPHPTLIGGQNPQVRAAGIVEIRGGRIYSVDNASGHFKPGPESLEAASEAFGQLPNSSFHRQFQGYSTFIPE